MNKNKIITKIQALSGSFKCSVVRELCIKNHWFTGGGENQYNKMFELIRYNYYELAATAIWLCSDTEYTIKEIEEIIITEIYNNAISQELIIE